LPSAHFAHFKGLICIKACALGISVQNALISMKFEAKTFEGDIEGFFAALSHYYFLDNMS
jgi:hypothetical protein